VELLEWGQQKAVLSFQNPLEPHRLERGDTRYELRLWVKHPQECPGGVDPEGVCRGELRDRQWTLTARSHLPAALWESTTASYALFQRKGGQGPPRGGAEMHGAKVAVQTMPGGVFRHWSPRTPLL